MFIIAALSYIFNTRLLLIYVSESSEYFLHHYINVVYWGFQCSNTNQGIVSVHGWLEGVQNSMLRETTMNDENMGDLKRSKD